MGRRLLLRIGEMHPAVVDGLAEAADHAHRGGGRLEAEGTQADARAVVPARADLDRAGRVEDITFGFDSLADWATKNTPYFGAVVGRYGNRIANGRFLLDGQTYALARNNGPNHLHGGVRGFDKVLWTPVPSGRPTGEPSGRMSATSSCSPLRSSVPASKRAWASTRDRAGAGPAWVAPPAPTVGERSGVVIGPPSS